MRDIEEIRAEHGSITEMLIAYGVPVRGNRYKPFCHGDSRNDFSGRIDERRGVCNCYVCNKTYDIFSLVGHFEGLSTFKEQVKFLGGDEPEDTPERIAKREQLKAQRKAREAAEKAERAAEEQYRAQCKRMHELRAILKAEKAKSLNYWPSKEYMQARKELQELDIETGRFVNDPLAGDLSKYPEAQW